MRVWILGSMGWMPSRGQQTACVLVERGDDLIMLDAGTGVANLGTCMEALERHDRLHVLLSHYHLDHIVGLMYLKRFVAQKRVDVYGPGRPVYAHTTERYASDVLQRAVYSSGALGFAREVHYHDYGSKSFDVGGVCVGVRRQRHSSPSFELRLDDELVYATDTCFDASEWVGVAPARLLLHECWQVGAGDPRHTSVEALAAGLPKDAFGRVVLIHQNPAWSAHELVVVERVAGARGFELAHDGMTFQL